ncbi:MAG: rhomboid family intramembrane serine protease [Phycisphaerae bacterium]
MGWQDRDYAKSTPRYERVYRAAGSRMPWGRSIVTTLILINVAIYVLGALFPPVGQFLSGHQRRSLLGVEIHYGIAEMWADGVMRGQVWRLLTAQYLHAGIGHIFINMLVLHFLGRPLERMWTARKFFAIYTLCGLSGNLFYTLLAWRGVIPAWMPAVGASGCIYGLLGIVAVLFPQATVYIYFLFPMKIRTAAYIFGGIAVLTILQRGGNYGGEACHLAGLVFGVWWAMKGDAWWATSGQAWWTWTRSRAPSVRRPPRTSKPRGFRAKIAQRREDEETIDRILKKVYEGGIHSLTEPEKRALQEATERQRQRDADAGRVDRL